MILYKKQRGFSLIEVMMTLLVLSLILVVMAPFMTKVFKKAHVDGVVFEYNGNSKKIDSNDKNNYCFVTNLDSNNKVVFEPTTDCSEYEFTVPNGVNSVNLTLVAGGGGGGGASGLLYWKDDAFLSKEYKDFIVDEPGETVDYNVFTTGPFNDFILAKNLKSLKINFMTAEGQPSKLNNCGWPKIDENGNYSYYCTQDKNDNLLFQKFDDDNGMHKKEGVTFEYMISYNNTAHSGEEEGMCGPSHYCVHYTGRGGVSSPALYNYEVPKQIYRGMNLRDILDNGSSSSPLVSLYFGSSAKKLYDDGDIIDGKGFNPEKYDRNGTYCSNNENESESPGTVKDYYMDLDTDYEHTYKIKEHTDTNGNKYYDYEEVKCTSREFSNGSKSIVYADLTIGEYTYTYLVSRLGVTAEDTITGSHRYVNPNSAKDDIITKNGGVYLLNQTSIRNEHLSGETSSNFNIPHTISPIPSTNILDMQNGTKGKPFFYNLKNDHELYPITKIADNGVIKDLPNNTTFLGGAGGDLSLYGMGNCGAGGQGYGFGFKDGKNIYIPSAKGGPACISVTATYIPLTPNEKITKDSKENLYLKQVPGGLGGAGGSAVRIVDFKVNPGETYIVRVGKGGTGGIGGSDVYAKMENFSNLPTDGKSGTGGTSTSIWKKDKNGNQTLIYLVTGGLGGFGGHHIGYDINTNTLKTPHKLISSSKNYINDATFDRNISTKVPDSGKINLTLNDQTTEADSIALAQAYLYKYPYIFLNYGNDSAGTYMNKCYTGGLTSGSNTCSSGFNNFSKGMNNDVDTMPDINFIENVKPNSMLNNTKVTAYDGLFYKAYSKNGGAAYVGGLGGFSGLGSKAGCGGMFMGNEKGLIKAANNSISTNKLLMHKFITSATANLYNIKNDIYDIFEYYDNCNINVPDGQSAEYVKPNPKEKIFGQAGSGGGGGGYMIDIGSGKGGDGQNGYLMIDWRK